MTERRVRMAEKRRVRIAEKEAQDDRKEAQNDFFFCHPEGFSPKGLIL